MGCNTGQGLNELAQTYIVLRVRETFDHFKKGEYVFLIGEYHRDNAQIVPYSTSWLNEAKFFHTEDEATRWLKEGPFDMVQVTMTVAPLPIAGKRATQKRADEYS